MMRLSVCLALFISEAIQLATIITFKSHTREMWRFINEFERALRKLSLQQHKQNHNGSNISVGRCAIFHAMQTNKKAHEVQF